MAGGQYIYLREAFHPMVAFLFGWTMLFVIQTGAIAAVSMVFSRYFFDFTHVHASEAVISGIAIGIFTVVNCFGVRTGATVQNVFMISKIVTILLLVGCGLFLISSHSSIFHSGSGPTFSGASLLAALGAAAVPVLL